LNPALLSWLKEEKAYPKMALQVQLVVMRHLVSATLNTVVAAVRMVVGTAAAAAVRLLVPTWMARMVRGTAAALRRQVVVMAGTERVHPPVLVPLAAYRAAAAAAHIATLDHPQGAGMAQKGG
jgi:hypothetical protein